MGNNSSRERRHQSSSGADAGPSQRSASVGAPGTGIEYPGNASSQGRSSRRTNNDHNLLFNLVGGAHHDALEVRRETKQEREARRLERERVARAKERERSMRDEHVDGGYLVTQGVYTGTEDFNKEIVRQLMIMRCIAPFWRGLEDFNSEWTEYQLVAAAKSLPIPPADQIPPEVEAPPPGEYKRPSTSNVDSLTVPMGGRTESTASDASANIAKILSSSDNTQASSPFRPRSKTIASLTSKSPSQSEMVPRETRLPVDPYVNGLRMEAFLYKDAIECPICFIYYPPYLNQTRCCDQPICSECFVQIRRPDPHPPEHPDPTNPAPPEENPETLVSEPANCPYCQQPEFGVTYDPPPFRRGLAYANMNGQMATAMAASDSTPNNGSSSSLRPAGSRRRATSVSANASNVVTTDKIRPDWATKLANARIHAARRSAAATALHTAAYLMGDGRGMEGRGFGFGSRSRFGGRTRDSPGESSTSATGSGVAQERIAALSNMAAQHNERQREGQAEGRRRSRMDDLEDMMMMEAIRLSIAAEEERKRKEEKEAKKEAKKKEKEQKKADKAAAKSDHKNGIYGGSGSRTASALSLVLPGRRRGNSGSSAMAREASNYSVEHTYPQSDATTGKGKEVDRAGSASSSSHPHPSGLDGSSQSFGQHLSVDESSQPQSNITSAPAAAGATPERPSHLRQISSASSPSSSYIESAPGSIRRGHSGFQASQSSFESPSASNTDLGHRRDQSRDRDNDPGSAGDEPMFNFRSLAEIVGREDEKDGYDANQVEYADENQRPVSQAGPSTDSTSRDNTAVPESDPFDDSEELMDQSVATLKADDYERAEDQTGLSSNGELKVPVDTPELMVTPVTPAPVDEGEGASKQLGH